MKYIIALFFYFLCLTACTNNTIGKATLSYFKDDRSLDSIVIKDKLELKIINKFLSTLTPFGDKLPVKYFLKIEFKNGTTQEFSGNSYFLRDKGTYYNRDTIIRKDFLKVINSKLPSYLQQK